MYHQYVGLGIIWILAIPVLILLSLDSNLLNNTYTRNFAYGF